MPDLKNCEYVLLEYAPSALRDIRLPIGLFLFGAQGRLIRQGFASDWRQVRCLDPQADIELLGSLPSYFESCSRGEIQTQTEVSKSENTSNRRLAETAGNSFY